MDGVVFIELGCVLAQLDSRILLAVPALSRCTMERVHAAPSNEDDHDNGRNAKNLANTHASSVPEWIRPYRRESHYREKCAPVIVGLNY